MENSDKKMADRIKYLRKKNDLTQEELGKIIGVQKSAIRKYEKGEVQNLKRTTIKTMADYFGVSPSYLLGWDDAPTNTPIKKDKHNNVPVLGRVAAGIPIDAIEEIIDYEQITDVMASSGEYFALKVIGDSMAPKFTEGDVVIVRKQEDVDNGDIAIMLINGNEATIKRVQKYDGGIHLIPTNQAYPILTFSNKEIEELPVRCLGKVVELRAKF